MDDLKKSIAGIRQELTRSGHKKFLESYDLAYEINRRESLLGLYIDFCNENEIKQDKKNYLFLLKFDIKNGITWTECLRGLLLSIPDIHSLKVNIFLIFVNIVQFQLFSNFMHRIDFENNCVFTGSTLYHMCIQGYVAKMAGNPRTKLTMADIIQRTIKNLLYMIDKGEQHKADLQKVLSKPNDIGDTVFETVCYTLGEKSVVDKLLELNIDINIVKLNFETCSLITLPEYNEILLKRKMNPKIINSSGLSPLGVLQQSSISITPKLRKLINMYPNAVYFSTVQQSCDEKCSKYCKSKMEPFRIGMNGNGEYITADDSTRIGHGGFGTVFNGEWHGRDSAFKYILIRDETSQNTTYVHERYNNFNKNIIEYREQMDVSRHPNSGVIIPNAFNRQQLQKQDDSGKWIAFNYNVFVYPRYDCNLHELHYNHFSKMTKQIKIDIIDQCYTR